MDTCKILLIGNGAREHVIAETLMRTEDDVQLFAVMSANNPKLGALCEETIVTALDDFKVIVDFAKKAKVEFAIIGPEAPLANGIVDALALEGIQSVGPKKSLAQLESSKGFTRDLMERYGIPGLPRFMLLKKEDNLKRFIDELSGVVVKPDGLTGGKGVKVQGDHFETKEEALQIAKELLDKDGRVLIEEKLIGEEFSLMSFCDGRHIIDCPLAQDHKRAYEDDKGPNTGGMGSYSMADHRLPFITTQDIATAHRINEKIAEALYRDLGDYFKGIMYGGFIATKDGVKLIEYNVRFGDPEAMNVLPILKTSLVRICRAVIGGTLNELTVEFEKKATVCKYAVPEGYPDKPVKGVKVEVGACTAKVYYASVEQKEDGLYLCGSRALAFVGIADTLKEAETIAQQGLLKVKGPVFFRPDIGTQKLIQKRIDHMAQIR